MDCYISQRTQTAFAVLRRLRDELPGRFNRQIDNTRQLATALISENKDKEASDALWQLVNEIDRQVFGEYIFNARRCVGRAETLRLREFGALKTALVEANSAVAEGNYGECVKKCRWIIFRFEQVVAWAMEDSNPILRERMNLMGLSDWQ